MSKIIIKSDNFFQDKSDNLSWPIAAIMLFCVLVPALCFYGSRKVILWESTDDNGVNTIFKQAVVAMANASETAKAWMHWDGFFQRENMAWRALKDSPLVFGQPEASLGLDNNRLPVGADPENPGNGDLEQKTVLEDSNEPLPEKSAGAVAALSTKPANTATSTIDTPFFNVAKKSVPFNILIIGDSLVAAGGGMGDSLERTLLNFKNITVVRQGKVSSGLSRQDYFNWPVLAAKLISQHKPNVAIMMFGANDNTAIIDANGKIIAGYGSAKWEGEYRKRVAQMLDLFTKANTEIFVLGIPIMKNQKLSQGMRQINSLSEQETKKYANAHFISTWDLLADKDGNYTSYLIDKDGNQKLARTADGVHLQYVAGYYVSDAIVKVMKNYLDISAK
ncbi:MAG: DUF459 domain-containing protein [Candidatus Paceibacterota bacterium]